MSIVRLTFSALVTIALIANASQLAAQSHTFVGVKAGPVVSSAWLVEKDIDVQFNPASGFTAGALFSFEIGDIFAVQPELLYTQKGCEVKFIEGGTPATARYRFDYVELPILARFTMPPGRKMGGSIYLGPFVAGLVSEQTDVTVGNRRLLENEIGEYRPDDGFTPFDGGAVIGAGLSFNLADVSVMVDLRYSMSAVPLILDEDFVANRYAALTAGFSF